MAVLNIYDINAKANEIAEEFKKMDESPKDESGILFEEMGLEYIGVINGHDISELISVLKKAKAMKKPCLVPTNLIFRPA